MADETTGTNGPPQLLRTDAGEIESGSLADLIDWFLNYDERTARIRHSNTESLFQWKQADDAANGIEIYPFENAESRFAIGLFQALAENRTEPMLALWLNDVIAALHDARTARSEMDEQFKLNENAEDPSIVKAEKLTANAEKRYYLTSCWLEALCTAEARVLGWVYQELYGKPFTPTQ